MIPAPESPSAPARLFPGGGDSWRVHMRATATLALPVAVGQLGQIMLGVVDSIMIGRLGAVPLAAASLGHSIWVLLLVFAAGMSAAVTPLVAIAAGRNRHAEAGDVLRHGLALNAIIGVLLTVCGLLAADHLHLLGQDPDVARLAAPFLRAMSFTYLPIMLFMTLRNFVEGLGFPRPAMVVVLCANLVNALGNWLLIYGHGGLPALGLAGSGISSVVAEVFMVCAMAVYVARAARFDRLRPLLRRTRVQAQLLRELLRVGTPAGVQYTFEAGAFSFAAVMIGWMGSAQLAAHQVALNLASVSYMAILGISNAATVRVGYALGQRDRTGARRAGFSAIVMGAALMAVAAMLFVSLRNTLPLLYTSDPAVVHAASLLLVIAALFQVFDGTQATGLGVLRGVTDTAGPMVISIAAYWVVGVPAGYGLGIALGYGAPGVWMGLLVGLVLAAVFFTLRFHRGTSAAAWEAHRHVGR